MNNGKYDNILFDLDGTLVDSVEDIVEALTIAFSSLHRGKQIIVKREFIGPPLKEIVKLVEPDLAGELCDKVIRSFRDYYDNCSHQKTIMKEGVRDTLDLLIKSNRNMLLVTNKPLIPTKKILNKFNLDCFRDVLTPDMHPDTTMTKSEMIFHLMDKWKLDKTSTLMVGDTAADVYAAKENGISSVALLNGYGDIDSINASEPDYTIEHIWELQAVLNK